MIKLLLLPLLLTSASLMAVELTVEEKRIPKAEIELATTASQFDEALKSFSKEYKGLYETKRRVAKQYGKMLWKLSRDRIQANDSLYDDRELYWARLKLSSLIRKNTQPHEPYLKKSITKRNKPLQVLWDMERASRGHNDISYSDKATKRILITGFDPFFLDRNIGQSNPSGLAALMLDGKTYKVGNEVIQIESAIFPVRFEDFDHGEVERFLKQYFKENSVDMIVTISMGRDTFDLERFPGLRRSAEAPGNLNVFTGATSSNPIIPMLNGKQLSGDEFVEFSLPVKAMMAVQKPYQVNDNHKVTTLNKSFEPKTLNELNGEVSVSGSGGGYLSNEISYRSINLRNKLNSDIPTGHLHTPRIKGFEPEKENTIVKQIEAIILSGAKVLK